MKKTCLTCEHVQWNRSVPDSQALAECKRNPPAPTESGAARWPRLGTVDALRRDSESDEPWWWCSEYKRDMTGQPSFGTANPQ